MTYTEFSLACSISTYLTVEACKISAAWFVIGWSCESFAVVSCSAFSHTDQVVLGIVLGASLGAQLLLHNEVHSQKTLHRQGVLCLSIHSIGVDEHRGYKSPR